MANRSYLYTIAFDPTERKKNATDRIASIAEYNYSIPLAFQILASQDPKISSSIVWDYEHPIAIVGNYAKGVAKLFSFLDEVKAKNLFPEKELSEQIEKTKTFLSRTDRTQEFAILECGEIFEMGDDELEEQNRNLFGEIKNIDKQIMDFHSEIERLNATIAQLEKDQSADEQKTKKKISELKREKWNSLAIDGWSDVLYFDFEAK